MITAGTYLKAHYFGSRKRLKFLSNQLLELAEEFGWRPQAWAVFSNHYHILASSPKDGNKHLGQFMRILHGRSARYVNELDNVVGRKVWHNYWDTEITHHSSYLARLAYINQNPVKHGLVSVSEDYDWCSMAWFMRNSTRAQYKFVSNFNTDLVRVIDPY